MDYVIGVMVLTMGNLLRIRPQNLAPLTPIPSSGIRTKARLKDTEVYLDELRNEGAGASCDVSNKTNFC